VGKSLSRPLRAKTELARLCALTNIKRLQVAGDNDTFRASEDYSFFLIHTYACVLLQRGWDREDCGRFMGRRLSNESWAGKACLNNMSPLYYLHGLATGSYKIYDAP